jgi:hypothetical protein
MYAVLGWRCNVSKTAVGLFENPGAANRVVHDLDVSAFPRNEIRILGEPRDMAATGVMSTPRTDFEVGLNRELKTFGATEREANAYVQGVRRGGVIVFATGSNEEVDNAAQVMNRHGAVEVEELIGREPGTGGMIDETVPAIDDSSTQTGRISQTGGGARMFVW